MRPPLRLAIIMQFSTLLSVLSIASASTFSLVTVHSGSDVQYKSVKISSDNSLSLNGETRATFSIGSDGSLYSNGVHVTLEQGALKTSETFWSGDVWTVEDHELKLEGSSSFVVCPGINNNIMFAQHGIPSNCANPIGVVLRAD